MHRLHLPRPLVGATLLALAAASLHAAPVQDYFFSQQEGVAYVPLASGTAITFSNTDDAFVNVALPAGFDFEFDGAAFTDVSITTNGWMRMGTGAASAIYTPISSTATTTDRCIAPMGMDMRSDGSNGEVRHAVLGDAPNRQFVVQWKDWQRFGATSGNGLDFQVILEEGTDIVRFRYGGGTWGYFSTTGAEVGIKGLASSATAFHNRASTTGWTTTTRGQAKNAAITMDEARLPAAGLEFVFDPTPPPIPPGPAVLVAPSNGAFFVVPQPTLEWARGGGGAVDTYTLYLGTDGGGTTTPTSLLGASGLELGTTTTFTPAAPLDEATTYYWQVVPSNAFGDAASPPIWSFTTEGPAFPPFVETFDSYAFSDTAAPPLGWLESGAAAGTSFVPVKTDASVWRGDHYRNVSSPSNPAARLRYTVFPVPDNEWLISPEIELGSGATKHYAAYDLAQTLSFGQSAQNFFADESLSIYVAEAGDWAGADLVATFNTANPLPNAGAKFYTDLSGYTGRVQVGFFARKSGTLGSTSHHVYVDNFEVQPYAAGVPAPVALVAPADDATDIGASVQLRWNRTDYSTLVTGFEVRLGTDNPPATLLDTVAPSASTYDATSLLPSTTYFWSVTPVNGEGPATGNAVYSFTTAPATNVVSTLPYANNFTQYLPAFWQEADGELPASGAVTFATAPVETDLFDSAWQGDSFGNVTSPANPAARIEFIGSTRRDWLITPILDVGTRDVRASFDLALTLAGSTTATTLDSDDFLAVVVSTDGGATWLAENELFRVDATNPPGGIPPAGAPFTIDLSAYQGQLRLGFYAYSLTGFTGRDLFLDNFRVEETAPEPPGEPLLAAPAPGALRVSPAPTLEWTAGISGGAPASYNVYLGTDGGGVALPTSVLAGEDAGAATSFPVAGPLEGGTTYFWAVEAVNSEGAAASPVRSFTTQFIEPVDPSVYSDNFELLDAFPPVDWLTATGALTPTVTFTRGPEAATNFAAWDLADFARNPASPNGDAATLFLFPFNIGAGDPRQEWLISPLIDLSSASRAVPTLEFTLASTRDFGSTQPGEFDADDLFAVVVSAEGGGAWSDSGVVLTRGLGDVIPIAGTTIQVPLAGLGGIRRVAFHGDSGPTDPDNDGVSLFVDNVRLFLDASSVEDWSLLDH